MSGGSNIVRLGETQAREALHTAVRQVCATANISPAEIRAICIVPRALPGRKSPRRFTAFSPS